MSISCDASGEGSTELNIAGFMAMHRGLLIVIARYQIICARYRSVFELQYHLHTHIRSSSYLYYNSSDTDRESAPNTMPETILCAYLSSPAIGLFVLLRYICGFGRS